MSTQIVSPREHVADNDPDRWEKLFCQAIALAGAGSCQMGAEGKHLFLNDILKLGETNGVDILGMKK